MTRLPLPVFIPLLSLSILACSKKSAIDSQPDAPAALSASVSPPASAVSSAPLPSVADWTPVVWERAYQAARGPAPTHPQVQAAVPAVVPSCANYEGRQFLRKKFAADYSMQVVATDKENFRRQREADKEWLPKQQAWFEAGRKLDEAFGTGVFPVVVDGAVSLENYGAPRSKAKLVPVDFGSSPELGRFRKELGRDESWQASFQCRLLGIVRVARPFDSRTKEAMRAAGISPMPPAAYVDMVSCQEMSSPPRLAVVLEVPVHLPQAKVSAANGEATIESYSFTPSPGLDPALVTASEGNVGSTLRDRIIEVSGVKRLARGEHGAPAYAILQKRNMPMRLAIDTAEYKQVWIASFDQVCADEGMACKPSAPSAAPSIKLLGKYEPEKPTATPTARAQVAPPRAEPGVGRWEASAREADRSLSDPKASHASAWEDGFFPTAAAGAMLLKTFPAPGKPADLTPPPPETNPLLASFRDALARRGGPSAFLCQVKDMGQEPNAPRSPLIQAALESKGQKTDEASQWNIMCEGDDTSHLGTILVIVPSYLAAAVIDGGAIKEYRLEHHGHFAPEIRDKLIDIATGSTLEIGGVGRFARSELKNSNFGRTFDPPPMWTVSLAKWQCPHEGAGCTQFEGVSMPMVRPAPGGLKMCEVSNRVYPPPPE